MSGRNPSSATAVLIPIDVAPRETKAIGALDEAELDALVVSGASNIRWLCGFSGSASTVVLTRDHITLVVDSRYAQRAADELGSLNSSAVVVVARGDIGEPLREATAGLCRIGLEADYVTWTQYRTYASKWLCASDLVDTVGLIDRLRAGKDSAELDRIELAAAYTDQALASVLGTLAEGPTEADFAFVLEAAIRDSGAEDVGFRAIVASGPNGAIAHHRPGDRKILDGDLVIVDCGAMVDGYRSDMTRTFALGTPEPRQLQIYQTVVEAQQAGVEAMNQGASTAAVDAAARQVIEAAGWGENFSHGTGHGVGLDIHELPRVAPGVADIYVPGAVATVEPGIYVEGFAGVRIEDTCVAEPSGARRVTLFAKELELEAHL